MMDLDTMDWAEHNPEEYRKWRDKPKEFWFTIQNIYTKKTRRVKYTGPNIKAAMHDCQEDNTPDWEII